MELIVIVILAVLLPIMSITSFVVGYNINAQKKILRPIKKEQRELTEDEKMLERIDKARI